MDSNTQVFFDFTITLRTLLRSPPRVYFREELSTLPTHIFNQASELSKSRVKHMFAKHSFSICAVIQVFHENHVTSVAKGVGLLVVKVLPRVVNLVVKSSNFKALFIVIFRPLLFSRQSTLQHFQPTLQLFKKLRRFDENTITGCQEFLQSNIYSNRMTMRDGVRNADITLQGDRCVPFISFPQNSYLFDHKSCWDGSVQVNGNFSKLRQQDMPIRYWILLKLRKQQRLELPVLLESGKTKSSLLKVPQTDVQLLNGLLKDLGRNFAQSGKFLLGFGQVVKLLNFVGKLQFRREDVFFLNGTSIYPTLPAIAPILYLSQRIVVSVATDIHPLNKLLLLSDVWIDSIAVGDGQHSVIILDKKTAKQPLKVNLRGIEPLKLTWGSEGIPH